MKQGTARGLRRISRVLAITGVVLAVLAVRVVLASRAELQEAERLHEQDDVDAAIVHYRRAARWYAPASPYPPRALTELATIARAAEREQETERALSAWRAVRAAIMSTRSFYVPHAQRLQQANERIAELMASQEPPPVDAGKSREELRAEHLALLTEPRDPHLGWTIVLLLGFAMWISGAFAFASRAIDEEDRLRAGPAWRWGSAVVAGLALFVIGMALA